MADAGSAIAGPPEGAAWPDGVFLTLHEAAARHGALRWVERRLYGLTGARAATPSLPPAVRDHLFGAATAHAWHAELWRERLPVLAGWDPEALTVPAGPHAEPAIDALEAAAGPAALLGGLYRVVVPALLVSLRRHAESLSPAAGRPVQRVLRVVLSDTEEELLAGGALLDELGPDAAAAAPPAGSTLAAALGERSGAEGLFPW